jgi:hypothetical protein
MAKGKGGPAINLDRWASSCHGLRHGPPSLASAVLDADPLPTFRRASTAGSPR